MPSIDCTLLADGPSDAALIPILEWVTSQHIRQAHVHCECADLRRLPTPPTSLDMRILRVLDLYPCQILFIHRDAESQDPSLRYDEIGAAIESALHQSGSSTPPHVCVVPVRATEAWLLMEEAAIRRAAGNPNGQMSLDLVPPDQIELIPRPKERLHELLKEASGLRGRRLKKFRPAVHARDVSSHLRCIHSLRALQAFRRLEADVKKTVQGFDTR